MERFERFRFSVPAVPLRRALCVSAQFDIEDGSGSGNGSGGSGSTFGSWDNGSDGSGFRFRFGAWVSF